PARRTTSSALFPYTTLFRSPPPVPDARVRPHRRCAGGGQRPVPERCQPAGLAAAGGQCPAVAAPGLPVGALGRRPDPGRTPQPGAGFGLRRRLDRCHVAYPYALGVAAYSV